MKTKLSSPRKSSRIPSGNGHVASRSPLKMLISGQWVAAQSGETFSTYNPATGEVICEVAAGGKPDIDRAVKAARAAFESGPWHTMTPSDRGRILWKLADLLEKN